MATRKFNSLAEYKSWLSATLILFVDRHGACLNEISLDTYEDRCHACDILHEFAGGCRSAVYHIEKALKSYSCPEPDPYCVADDFSVFLRSDVRTSFGDTANIDYGCSLVDSLCGFLDFLEVDLVGGVICVIF